MLTSSCAVNPAGKRSDGHAEDEGRKEVRDAGAQHDHGTDMMDQDSEPAHRDGVRMRS